LSILSTAFESQHVISHLDSPLSVGDQRRKANREDQKGECDVQSRTHYFSCRNTTLTHELERSTPCRVPLMPGENRVSRLSSHWNCRHDPAHYQELGITLDLERLCLLSAKTQRRVSTGNMRAERPGASIYWTCSSHTP
jgi:hypothetical protein